MSETVERTSLNLRYQTYRLRDDACEARLRAMLLGTGEAKLVEHTANDDYWDDGGDGTGKNVLGRILIDVREELRAEDGAVAGER